MSEMSEETRDEASSTEPASGPAPTTERPTAPSGGVVSAPVAVVGAVLVLGGALGALGGWLWWRWWGPANTGSVYQTDDGPKWYDLTAGGFTHVFDGTAQYAVIGLGFGLLLGIAAGLLSRRHAVLGLVAVVVASALGAVVAAQLGYALSPPDPQQYETAANVCEKAPCKEYPAALRISGWTPYLTWAIGALASYFIVMLSGPTPPARRSADVSDRSEPLPPA